MPSFDLGQMVLILCVDLCQRRTSISRKSNRSMLRQTLQHMSKTRASRTGTLRATALCFKGKPGRRAQALQALQALLSLGTMQKRLY
jgi:hypothetical protein